jgi:prefoldin subunit 5
MVSVIDKIAAEHENIIKVLDEIRKASKREEMEMVVLVGIGAYINNVYNGIENILKQILLSRNVTIVK